MEALTEPFSYPFFLRALLMIIFIGVSGGMVGSLMVLRRMSLMGDALAHSLLPGMALAYLFLGESKLSLFVGAVIAGGVTAIASSLVSLNTRLREDASFGAFFVMALALGVALVSSPQLGIRVDLLDFLFGNVLSITNADLWISLFMTTFTLVILSIFYRDIAIESFDCDFYRVSSKGHKLVHTGLLVLIVLNLVTALQALGAILSLSIFILPAVCALLWTNVWGRTLFLSSLLAVVGGVIGLFVSYHLRVPSGPSIALSLGVIYLFSLAMTRR